MKKIGMSTSNLAITANLKESIEFAQRHSFNCLEIWADFPHAYPDYTKKNERKTIKKMANNNGMDVAVHSPMFNINIASLNPGIRAESIRQVKSSIDLAADLEAKIVVLHPGTTPFPLPAVKKAAQELNLEAMNACLTLAKKRGVELALENIGLSEKNLDSSLNEFCLLVETLGVGVAFDLAHAYLSWGIPATLERLKEKIIHVHINDAKEGKDSHLPVGLGEIDYSIVKDFLSQFEGMMIIEVFYPQDLEGGILRSREKLLEVLNRNPEREDGS
ncbi:MAG: sugar phosphate isomerase/epimerase family protein [bacterium]